MNNTKLKVIFDNYISKFDIINDRPERGRGHDENYKWRLAAKFRSLMNPDSPDFIAGMKSVRKLSYNLIDSRWQYPLNALVRCAENDETAVRSLFRNLFADDGGDLVVRQHKVDDFLAEATALTAKTYSGYRNLSRFRNDQRSVMSYIFFNDPEHNYLYKPTQARVFAKCADFEDGWGCGTSFKMDVYYRMCGELVEAIKNYPPLLEATKRRYSELPLKTGECVHPDENYHILAFDIIWGTGITGNADYNFGDGISYL